MRARATARLLTAGALAAALAAAVASPASAAPTRSGFSPGAITCGESAPLEATFSRSYQTPVAFVGLHGVHVTRTVYGQTYTVTLRVPPGDDEEPLSGDVVAEGAGTELDRTFGGGVRGDMRTTTCTYAFESVFSFKVTTLNAPHIEDDLPGDAVGDGNPATTADNDRPVQVGTVYEFHFEDTGTVVVQAVGKR